LPPIYITTRAATRRWSRPSFGHLPYVVPYVGSRVPGVKKSSLYLPDRLKSSLAARAASTGRSEAELIRGAIEAMLSAGAGTAARPDPPVGGRLIGIGVGPGEPDLLTSRAITALRRADRVVAPTTSVDSVGRAETIVREALPDVAVIRVSFSMNPSRAARDRSVNTAAAAVVGYLNAGDEVAWVTLGDPLTYSTFSAVAERVRKLRPSTVVEQVPGIMAFQSLAARTGTVIADERTRVSIRTGLDGDELDGDLIDPSSTLIVYKGGRRLPEIAAQAARRGRNGGAVAGELLGMPGERVGPLASFASSPASYLATVIFPASRKGPR
jgi:precorrin-2/cobalt-factor-2 C20-methyltransferase